MRIMLVQLLGSPFTCPAFAALDCSVHWRFRIAAYGLKLPNTWSPYSPRFSSLGSRPSCIRRLATNPLAAISVPGSTSQGFAWIDLRADWGNGMDSRFSVAALVSNLADKENIVGGNSQLPTQFGTVPYLYGETCMSGVPNCVSISDLSRAARALEPPRQQRSCASPLRLDIRCFDVPRGRRRTFVTQLIL